MTSGQSIAFVANTSWSICQFRLYLLQELIADGYQVYVLAPRDKYSSRFENIPGLRYIELHHFKGKSISPFSALRLYRELLGHYRTIRPDLIFHYTIKANIFGAWAAARAKCPSVGVITGLGYAFTGNPLLTNIVRIIYRPALRSNAETWFLNADDLRAFQRQRLVEESRTFILPGEGVDTQRFQPLPESATIPEPGHGPGVPVTFLLIGRMIRHKGIFEFVEAAAILKKKGLHIHAQLLGKFDEDNPVAIPRRQVDEWTRLGTVTYLGHTDDVVPFIRDADCVVLPSYREGMPLSLLEGASMCKALIGSDAPGCRETIDDGLNGYLCAPKNGKDLALKMEKYYNLPAAAKRQMGIEGRNKVLRQFTREKVVEIYSKKILQLLQGDPGKT
jgi:glycosyltransferase involved in cell wall biosynthesis